MCCYQVQFTNALVNYRPPVRVVGQPSLRHAYYDVHFTELSSHDQYKAWVPQPHDVPPGVHRTRTAVRPWAQRHDKGFNKLYCTGFLNPY